MSRFFNLPPEVQSILVAITGTVAGTIVSNLITSKKIIRTIIIVIILAVGIGIRLALHRYMGGNANNTRFRQNGDNGISVSNPSFNL